MDRPLCLPIIDEVAFGAVDSIYNTGTRRSVFCSFMATEEIDDLFDLGNWLKGDFKDVRHKNKFSMFFPSYFAHGDIMSL